MFQNLTERLNITFKSLRGQGRLTESNMADACKDVRRALIEADVALPVVDRFLQEVKDASIGQNVAKSLNPGQAFIKIVHQTLIHVLGEHEPLNLNAKAPVVILMAGLQGAGKTTTVAKLAHKLKTMKKTVAVASCDIYRPAAIEQLKTLATQVGAVFLQSEGSAIDIATSAISQAKAKLSDVLILDTAGRLHIDDDMMAEIKAIHKATSPTETLFVVDSMTGQDAAHTAKAFHEALPLTGVVLSKCDGDARGGAALSVSNITGKPIKFMGVGEKIDNFEVFHPDRVASRILDMGDLLSLIEEAESKIDKSKAQKLAKKVKTGKTFNLIDFKEQLMQMQNLGGMGALMQKLPGMNAIKNMPVDDGIMDKTIAIINSMTPQERKFPKVIGGSRKKRIATGSGTEIQDVNKLLKQFNQMQKMMKKFSKPGAMKNMMRQFKHLLPPQ